MTSTSWLVRLFANPVVDKVVAGIAVAPVCYIIYVRLVKGEFDLVRINLLLMAAMNVIPMLVRRPPSRVSLNPVYWIVAFLAAYWIPFPALDTSPAVMIVPYWFGIGLSFLGLLLTAYARFSLGRNIGLVPAQRNLVLNGAYGYVRHPIYTAIFVSYISVLVLHYSQLRLILVCIGIFLFLVRSLMEERFLSADPRYVEYTRRVRHRWIPGLV